MSDSKKEKDVAAVTETRSHDGAAAAHIPTGTGPLWFYKPIKLGPWSFYYASPAFQLVLISMVCFMCPGMFNAINGIGASGQADAKLTDKQNAALYSCFCVVAFFAGSIVNKVGVRSTLSVCGYGYVLYIGAYLCYNHTRNEGFVIASGVILGICAGLLWAAQGAILMSYPHEADKGKYISWFWMIFNLGAVVGSFIPLGETIQGSKTGVVTDGVYAAFIVLMFSGCLLALGLCNSKHVIRKDGSRIIVMKHPSWQSEIWGLWEVLRYDWHILLLAPMFFVSNFFYAYHFQVVNLQRFTLRTRSLNGVLYYIAQIIGAYLIGYGLDYKGLSRKTRARVAFGVLTVLTFVVWGGGYVFQKQSLPRPADPVNFPIPETDKIDWASGAYIGPMFLYMFYGAYDAIWQTTVYWFMGAMTNNSRKLAHFAGFYKAFQSAGSAVSNGWDSTGPAFMTEFAANWALLAGGLLFAAPLILFKVQETIPLEEDLKFSDETIEEVQATEVAPIEMAKEAKEVSAGHA